MELPAHVRPATGQDDGVRPALGKGPIRRVTITLHGAVEVHRNDVLQAHGCTAGGSVEEHIAARTTARPQVTLAGFTLAWRQIINRIRPVTHL